MEVFCFVLTVWSILSLAITVQDTAGHWNNLRSFLTLPCAVVVVLRPHASAAFQLLLHSIPRGSIVQILFLDGLGQACVQLLRDLVLVDGSQDASSEFSRKHADQEEDVKSQKALAVPDGTAATAKAD
eukprot:GHVL01005981.1.p2 GENE.GHVL01005981.1~~GHVL01005981.1.p2  ORF type:complete len:128 (-),score=5.02 GHVL01005981.1:369-752(-)